MALYYTIHILKYGNLDQVAEIQILPQIFLISNKIYLNISQPSNYFKDISDTTELKQ